MGLQRADCAHRSLAWAGRLLVDVDDPAPSDAIVVLAGRTPERELEGADLYRAGLAPLILMTLEPEEPIEEILHARGIPTVSRLDQRLRDFQAFGVPANAITVLQPEVRSTMDEAEAIAAWTRAHRVASLLIVTSAYHTARSRFAFTHALRGTGVTVRLRAAAADPYEPESLWQRRRQFRNTILEWGKFVVYRLRYCCR